MFDMRQRGRLKPAVVDIKRSTTLHRHGLYLRSLPLCFRGFIFLQIRPAPLYDPVETGGHIDCMKMCAFPKSPLHKS